MKAFLIPGGLEDFNTRNYQAVLDVYKNHGYEPEFVNINWTYRTFDSWQEDVAKQVSAEELKDALLAGFSWGAMLAFAAAAEIHNPALLHTYSLSPFFAEDMPFPKSYLTASGKRRIKNFEAVYFNPLAQKVNCPTIAFLGSKEKAKYPEMWRRSLEAKRQIKSSQLILIDGVGHDVADSVYLQAINKSLS